TGQCQDRAREAHSPTRAGVDAKDRRRGNGRSSKRRGARRLRSTVLQGRRSYAAAARLKRTHGRAGPRLWHKGLRRPQRWSSVAAPLINVPSLSPSPFTKKRRFLLEHPERIEP